MAAKNPLPESPAGAPREKPHVCPWWLGYFLCCPLRRFVESPSRILAPYVRPGMTVLEPGCGMGWFTVEIARRVGSEGRVVCADVQERMIRALRRRVRRAGVADRVETILCPPASLGVDAWKDRIDLVVAIHVVHEVPDPAALFREIRDALRAGGRALMLEPRSHGHVTPESFEATVAIARTAGLREVERPSFRRSLAVLLEKPAAGAS